MSETEGRSAADQDRAGPAPEEEMLRSAGRMLGEGRELLRDYLDLLAVEGQLAGRSLVLMLALSICLAIVLVAAWIFLTLSGVMWLTDLGLLSVAQALLAGAVAHLVLALLIWFSVRHLSRNLVFGGFRETLDRQSNGEATEDKS
jgi:hypothetical protein